MSSISDGTSRWEVAVNPEEVHSLLSACDVVQANKSGTPVPRRRYATTQRRVLEGAVHLLRCEGMPVATFTLTPEAPFDVDDAGYVSALNPRYMQRLAIHPELLQMGSVVGVQCIRRAVRLAADCGADVLRAEANPDLTATSELLGLIGFVRIGALRSDGEGRCRVYLERGLQA